MTNRLFIALDLPGEIQDEIIGYRDQIYGDATGIKWEAKDKLHLTLKFIGDVDVLKNDEINAELEKIISDYPSINMNLEKFGMFYRGHDPRILWVGLNGGDELFSLQSEIESGMERIGFPKENRIFKPHITLLRVKGLENFNKLKDFEIFDMPQSRFVSNKISLIKSKLTPKGSIYTTVKSFNLI